MSVEISLWSIVKSGMVTVTTSASLIFKGFGGSVSGFCDGGTPPIVKNQVMPMPSMWGFTNGSSNFGHFARSESRIYREDDADIGTILSESIVAQHNRSNPSPFLKKPYREPQ